MGFRNQDINEWISRTIMPAQQSQILENNLEIETSTQYVQSFLEQEV